MRTRAILYLTALLLLSTALQGKDKKKVILPDYVLDAKTVSVVVDPEAPISATHPDDNRKAADDVEQALLKWGRYRLVTEPYWADLVILIRKGGPPGAAIGGTGNGSDRPVIVQQPTNTETRAGVQWGTPPQISSTQQSQQPRHPGAGPEAGTTADVFELYQGQSQYPLDGPIVWWYSGANALNTPDVKAVEQFRKVVAEADKARH